MAFLIAQGSSSLYKIDLTSGTATALTLPTGVTLSTTRKPKFAVLKNLVVMCNSPSRTLAIDAEGIVRPLVLIPPTHGPDVSAGSGTGLTGAYKFKCSFFIEDADGNLLFESPLSDYYREVTLANQNADIQDIPISPDTITGRRIYRTLTGGTEYRRLLSIYDNTTRRVINNTADSVLELLPTSATDMLSPPGTVPGVRMKTIIEWKSRLWGVGTDDPDTVWVTDTNKPYAWTHKVVIHPTGQDAHGIIGFAPRRDQLGVIRRNGVWQIAADSSGTGIDISDISVVQLAPHGGSLSPDTIIARNNRVMWLGNDGVYEWGSGGIVNVSDATVLPWFQTDTYFTRSRFPNAFAKFNELRQSYDIHLAALGSSVEDRWVSYNLTNGKFFGPHKTDLFTPNHATQFVDENGLPVCVVGGSDGVVYTANSANKRDGAATSIDFDAYGPFHHGGDPDAFHYFGELSVMSKIQGSGDLTITPYVGGLDASAGTAITHDMTTGRQLLRRIGLGRLARLRFRQNTVNVGAALYGYEIDPVERVGRR